MLVVQKDVRKSVPNTGTDTLKNIKPGRLQKRPEFLCVAQHGKKWVSKTVIVQFLDKTESNQARIGYTATKKMSKLAVTRNKAKRRLRAAIETLVQEGYNLPTADLVLIARDATVTCEWNQLVKDLRWCLKRLETFEDDKMKR